MIFHKNYPPFPVWAKDLNQNYRCDEEGLIHDLMDQARLPTRRLAKIRRQAHQYVEVIRQNRRNQGGIDSFMQQYDLSTQEGLVLMCLAEALLRIPDTKTVDDFIEDKLSDAHWENYLGKSDSLFVNASTFGLMISGKIIAETNHHSIFHDLLKRSGEPLIRQALRQAMKIMGSQFVFGRTIEEALARTGNEYRYSFDMLGEAARTRDDADRYFNAYKSAIQALTRQQRGRGPIEENGISIKLSALHPRYEMAKRERVLEELVPLVLDLARDAAAAHLNFTIDAEESYRLELSLEVIEQVFSDPCLAGWNGFGLAVQAYQKRALDVIDLLASFAQKTGRKIMVRLVKGAYWDSEIKWAQEQGQSDYPVFTRKAATDVSYMACMKKLLACHEYLFAQFASHNAYTVACVQEIAGDIPFEFQRLHGMGDGLFDQIKAHHPVRVYAPVGSHEDLLSYLVRRLLENGANSSFVNRLVDDATSIEEITQNPVEIMEREEPKRHPHIPLPIDLFGKERRNSTGLDLSESQTLLRLQQQLEKNISPKTISIDVEDAIIRAQKVQPEWNNCGVAKRADLLRKTADLMEENREQFLTLSMTEAKKTVADSLGEFREAVDFLHYYAAQGEKLMSTPTVMAGPTGEYNELQLHGRGVFACISPWNFPLAIFLGQVSAALITGNTVLAKPADQTPKIAQLAIECLHHAGVPDDVVQLICGKGSVVGQQMVADERINGVCFTGSNETAKRINRTLAARTGAIVPLIAETGGQNAMIIDSTALLEASVQDVLTSAFGAAGQRCSALRVLYLQHDIADGFISLLKGAMAELIIGDPTNLTTDIGPLIDQAACDNIQSHINRMNTEARLLAKCQAKAQGTFIAPHVFEIDHISDIQREVFGPVLHIIRYDAHKLDQVIEEINSTGFGLTCSLHSRIDHKARNVQSRIKAGNCYINRNMIGAVVGVNPFGGEGLSGTGPKAGGPHYLLRFVTERTLTINVTASGGNASLLSL
ncbi:bifunctional proline dehydrogenase/L-glutamate gamma-semialdehyde dehydrogenase PutA [Terasakiella sp. SH-1]|uniref:bifunctional proline dehydrogenase/L-glutamate gamma-semialdehyde dehydrogenase PutA n=1 Tax=Terasakiella sp. SH-1 TaxID=2560057 RepID=UPI0010737BAA|nr:bifunctional proline dehydrogenase/L-glutamate gamma-semialdehyde dehydrogenase PutA [Terasakiella sp. SH-1]